MPSSTSSSDHLVSGACAGFCATGLLHPLDLIKTRLHVQDQPASAPAASAGGLQERGSSSTKQPGRRLPYYRGLADACRSILRIEGWRGFYQGLAPNLVGNTAGERHC